MLRPKKYNFKSRSSQFRDFKIKRVGQSQPKAIKFTFSDIILKAVLKQNLSHALLSSRRWKGEGWIRWLLKSVWVEKSEYHFFLEILTSSLIFIFMLEKKKFKKSWSEKNFLFDKKKYFGAISRIGKLPPFNFLTIRLSFSFILNLKGHGDPSYNFSTQPCLVRHRDRIKDDKSIHQTPK